MRYFGFILTALCFLLYANTLQHGFVLDDEVVLTQNAFVQEGLQGIPDIFGKDSFAGYLQQKGVSGTLITGGRYRPFSIAVFAVLVSIFGNNAFLFHAFQLLLFAACCLVFYRTIRYFTHNTGASAWIAPTAALLFAVHPVHTEVVANIKSADELWAFLLGISGFYLLVCRENAGGISFGRQIAAGILLLLAMLSKESAVVWFALIPLAFYIRSVPARAIMRHFSIPLMAFALFVLLRLSVIGWGSGGSMMHDPMNNPFLHIAEGQWSVDSSYKAIWKGSQNSPATIAETLATNLFTFEKYVQLMVWPHPLSHDYYPQQIALQNWAGTLVWLGLILLLALVTGMVWLLQKKYWAAWGLALFLLGLLPVSNVFFPIGAFMAERFLFLPSAGFLMALSWLIWQKDAQKHLKIATLSLVILVFALLTFNRNPAWASNLGLYSTDIKNSPRSAKLQFSLANVQLPEALKIQDTTLRNKAIRQALPHFEQAVALHPFYYDAWQGVGTAHFFLGHLEAAADAYAVAHTLFPENPAARQNLAAVLLQLGQQFQAVNKTPEAIAKLELSQRLYPDTFTMHLIGRLKGYRAGE